MLPVLIACSNDKRETQEAVLAKDLYTGTLFDLSLKAAIRYSTEVYILSAGYGLLALNDIVFPYDIKMTPSRALWFRRNNIAVFDQFYSLLPAGYQSAVVGDSLPLFSSPGLGIGEQMSECLALATGKSPLFDPCLLPRGAEKTLLHTGAIKQENRTGKSLNICSFIGDLFEKERLTLAEADSRLSAVFGPPVGLSYLPTIRRQLYVQAKKRGWEIQKDQVEGRRILRYSYIPRSPG